MPRFRGQIDKATVTHIQHDVRVADDKIMERLVTEKLDFDEWVAVEEDIQPIVASGKLYDFKGLVGGPVNIGPYKQIPQDIMKEVRTKLSGEFCGKVYYKHDKILSANNKPIVPGDSATEEEDPNMSKYFNSSVTGKKLEISGLTTEGVEHFGENLVIPNTIDGVNVTRISDYAFKDKQLKSVKFTGQIDSIGTGAFQNNKITSVNIPSSITTISASAFMNNLIDTVILPNDITEVSYDAFRNNPITNLSLNGKLKTIGANAFANNSLKELVIPANIETLGTNSLIGDKLEVITILADIKGNISALDSVFDKSWIEYGCERGTYTKHDGYWYHEQSPIPQSNPENLFTYTIDSDRVELTGLTELGESTFTDSLVIPRYIDGKSVFAIENGAFNNGSYTTLILPPSVKIVYGNTFKNSSLIKIAIGRSVQPTETSNGGLPQDFIDKYKADVYSYSEGGLYIKDGSWYKHSY